MINFLWIGVVIVAIITQWYIIVKLRRYPNKPTWAFLRIIVASLFLFAYVQQGYMWYWALNYMVFTFWLPFNASLNLLRGKPITYLSPKNSWVDKIILKVFKYEFIVFVYAFMSMLFAVGAMYYFGKCPWVYVNAGFCI